MRSLIVQIQHVLTLLLSPRGKVFQQSTDAREFSPGIISLVDRKKFLCKLTIYLFPNVGC